MPRHRKPTNLLKFQGNLRKNATRAGRENEPVAGPFPDSPPNHLTPDEKTAWLEIVGVVAPGVLQSSDVIHCEVCARLLAKFRASVSIDIPLVSRLSIEMNKLGLSPSGRAALRVTPARINPYEGL